MVQKKETILSVLNARKQRRNTVLQNDICHSEEQKAELGRS